MCSRQRDLIDTGKKSGAWPGQRLLSTQQRTNVDDIWKSKTTWNTSTHIEYEEKGYRGKQSPNSKANYYCYTNHMPNRNNNRKKYPKNKHGLISELV